MNTQLINDRGVPIITLLDVLGFISAINLILFIVVGPLTIIFPSMDPLIPTQVKFMWAILMYRWLQ
jgi:hypothetical protein